MYEKTRCINSFSYFCQIFYTGFLCCLAIMISKNKIEEPVALELKQFQDDFVSSLQSSTKYLQQAVDLILTHSGKHIRPLLVLLSAKACGKTTSNTINSAVLLELLHTATLIHDDVVDETKQRRGAPSLNAIVDNRVAVLAGDYILSSALVRAIQTGDSRIVYIISNLGRLLSEGELKQLEIVEENVLSEERYLQVIYKKTASLLSACTEIGAISAGVSDEMIALCKNFGEYLGYCFQIKDDIFDYNRTAVIGKPTGNDIREGKITLPLLFALRTGEEREVKIASHLIETRAFTEENIDWLISFAIENGGICYAEEKMLEYKEKAVALLHQLAPSPAKEALLLLADYIVQRDK